MGMLPGPAMVGPRRSPASPRAAGGRPRPLREGPPEYAALRGPGEPIHAMRGQGAAAGGQVFPRPVARRTSPSSPAGSVLTPAGRPGAGVRSTNRRPVFASTWPTIRAPNTGPKRALRCRRARPTCPNPLEARTTPRARGGVPASRRPRGRPPGSGTERELGGTGCRPPRAGPGPRRGLSRASAWVQSKADPIDQHRATVAGRAAGRGGIARCAGRPASPGYREKAATFSPIHA